MRNLIPLLPVFTFVLVYAIGDFLNRRDFAREQRATVTLRRRIRRFVPGRTI